MWCAQSVGDISRPGKSTISPLPISIGKVRQLSALRLQYFRAEPPLFCSRTDHIITLLNRSPIMPSLQKSPSYKSLYDTHGFVVVPDLIPAALFPRLVAAAQHITARTRTGDWQHRRTVGRQFPPYDEDGDPDVWGVQHVMHPDLGEGVFAEWYISEGLVSTACELMGCEEGEVQMGGYWRNFGTLLLTTDLCDRALQHAREP